MVVELRSTEQLDLVHAASDALVRFGTIPAALKGEQSIASAVGSMEVAGAYLPAHTSGFVENTTLLV